MSEKEIAQTYLPWKYSVSIDANQKCYNVKVHAGDNDIVEAAELAVELHEDVCARLKAKGHKVAPLE